MIEINGISYKKIKSEEFEGIRKEIKSLCEKNKNFDYIIMSNDRISKIIITEQDKLDERKEVIAYKRNDYYINIENKDFLNSIISISIQ